MAILEFLLPIHRFGSKLRMLVVMNTLSPTSLHFSFLTWEYFHHTLMADSCIIALENRINLGVIWCPLVLTFPWWLRWYRICLQCGRPRFIPGVGKILWRRDRLPTWVFLGFPCGSAGNNLPTTREAWVQSLGFEDALEKGKATPSSILAWRIPWTV